MIYIPASGIFTSQLSFARLSGLLLPFIIVIGGGCARSQPAANKDWVRFELGNPKLIVSVPGPVVAKEANVNPETLQILQRSDTYQYLHPTNQVMGIFQFAQYTEPMVVTPQEALMTGLSKMFSSMNTTDAKFDTEELILLYRTGVKAKGGFTFNSRPWVFYSVVVIHGDSMWQLWMAADKTSETHVRMLDDMVESIGFLN